MSTILTCPICGRSHDVSSRLTGDVILCQCGAPLLVQHGVGASRVTQLRPDVQASLWQWLEAEVAALWLEIYKHRSDLTEGERLAEADSLYGGPPTLLIDTLAYGRAWDDDVAAMRAEVRVKRIEEAAHQVWNADRWHESAAAIGAEPSEFDQALQDLYDVLGASNDQ